MRLIFLKMILSAFVFFAPAIYAAVLVLLENIFGGSAYIHVAVFAVSMLSILYASYSIIKDRGTQRDERDEEDDIW